LLVLEACCVAVDGKFHALACCLLVSNQCLSRIEASGLLGCVVLLMPYEDQCVVLSMPPSHPSATTITTSCTKRSSIQLQAIDSLLRAVDSLLQQAHRRIHPCINCKRQPPLRVVCIDSIGGCVPSMRGAACCAWCRCVCLMRLLLVCARRLEAYCVSSRFSVLGGGDDAVARLVALVVALRRLGGLSMLWWLLLDGL
jgi:hypothetical protein